MEILSMGGYGGYVWTAYALTFGVIVLCAVQARRRHRRVLQDLRIRLEAAETGK
jgi:heme exporter protein CcmD